MATSALFLIPGQQLPKPTAVAFTLQMNNRIVPPLILHRSLWWPDPTWVLELIEDLRGRPIGLHWSVHELNDLRSQRDVAKRIPNVDYVYMDNMERLFEAMQRSTRIPGEDRIAAARRYVQYVYFATPHLKHLGGSAWREAWPYLTDVGARDQGETPLVEFALGRLNALRSNELVRLWATILRSVGWLRLTPETPFLDLVKIAMALNEWRHPTHHWRFARAVWQVRVDEYVASERLQLNLHSFLLLERLLDERGE